MEEREEIPPRLDGHGGGGGAGMKRHEDPVYEGFLQPPLPDPLSRSHRKALQRWV